MQQLEGGIIVNFKHFHQKIVSDKLVADIENVNTVTECSKNVNY